LRYLIYAVFNILLYYIYERKEKKFCKNYKFYRIHEKHDFAEISKNLARYRCENNFVGIIKIIMENV